MNDLPKEDSLLLLTNTTNTINTNNKAIPFSDLFPEILSKVASYLAQQDLHSCLFLSRSLSPHFTAHLWRTLDLRRSYHRKITPTTNLKQHYLTEPEVDEKFRWFKASVIDTEALHRNGQFILVLKGAYVAWLVFFGPEICPSLVELEICGYVYPRKVKFSSTEITVADPTVLSAFLRQQQSSGSSGNSLRRLILWERIVNCGGFLLEILRSIPASVEELELRGWIDSRDDRHRGVPTTGQGQKSTSSSSNINPTPTTTTTMTTTTPTPRTADNASTSAWLPNIKKLVFLESLANHKSMARLLQECPNLESLAFHGSEVDRPIDFARFIRTSCPKMSSLNLSRSCGDRFGSLRNFYLSMLLYASIGGWKTVALAYEDAFSFGPTCRTALLHHADAIETLYMEGVEWKGEAAHQFLCSAAKLKRFLAIPSGGYGMFKTLQDVSMIPRPKPPRLKHVPVKQARAIQKSLQFQRRIYRQLGWLTKLKELVLGDIEMDEMFDNLHPLASAVVATGQEEEEEEEEKAKEKGRDEYLCPYHFECLDMTFESGMGYLKNLKQLRRVGVHRLQNGFMKSPQDRRWVKKNWPLLQRFYRENFWKHYKRWQ
ncbi:hypothetical protein BGX29_006784 [Mortierella sp. GBA35]|nr:hypothetical protein BGX29_006784 [Mortierella sp. GBA35]